MLFKVVFERCDLNKLIFIKDAENLLNDQFG